jgi:hypothetical protein
MPSKPKTMNPLMMNNSSDLESGPSSPTTDVAWTNPLGSFDSEDADQQPPSSPTSTDPSGSPRSGEASTFSTSLSQAGRSISGDIGKSFLSARQKGSSAVGRLTGSADSATNVPSRRLLREHFDLVDVDASGPSCHALPPTDPCTANHAHMERCARA